MAQSSDPDAAAVMGSFDHPEAANDSDAAAVLASFDGPKSSAVTARTPPTATQHVADVLGIVKRHPFTAATGLAENALSGITGGVGSLADAVTGSDPGTHDYAYRPRTEAGKDIAAAGADEAAAVGRGYDAVAGTGPLAQTLKERVPEAVGAIGTVTGLAEVPKGLGAVRGAVKNARTPGPVYPKDMPVQEVLDRNAANSPQSMGAAASAPRLNSLSPELQQGVRNAVQQTGGTVNPEILARHVEADSLPIKMRLSEGQAAQDPQIISQEMNTRGRTPETVANLNLQNQQLIDNVRELRDRVGPDVFTTNEVEHGDTLIKAYKDKADVADADIDAKYKALRDANGGTFPVDAKQLYGNAAGALHQQLLFEHAPKELGQLESLANKGSMSFEQFEALRTNLARTMRSSSNGNEVAAATTIRQAMEDLPLSGDVATLKPLADQARSAARTQFTAVKADPAYDAALSGRVAPDQFVRKFITGPSATRDGVAQMRAMIGDDDVARQTMAVAALDHLRKSAGVDPMGNGNFTQAGYNKALASLDPKLQSLVDPKTAENLGTLGNVARYTQNQPRGSYVNNSNTLVGALAEHSKNLAEGAANKVLGFGVIPVGTMVREASQKRAATKAAAKSWAPGAGLTRLSDVAKQ